MKLLNVITAVLAAVAFCVSPWVFEDSQVGPTGPQGPAANPTSSKTLRQP